MREKEGVTNIKKLALLAVLPLVAGLLVFNGEQRAAADDLSDGLVGYWKFDEGSGSIVLDSSGYGNNGTINGGASYTSTGIAPTPGNVSALTFDGVDDFVAVPHADVLDMTAAYTLAAWVNINDVNTYQPILFRGTTPSITTDIGVYVHTGVLVIVHYGGTASGAVYFVPPPTGTLFHLAVVFDGTVVQAYYDGVPAALSPVLPAPLDTNQGWLIGKGSFEFDLLKGLIDEMRIYNRALSEDEIVALANPPILSVSPTSLDFGSVLVGSTKDLTFTVTNGGGGTLTGSVTTSAPFSIVSGSSFSGTVTVSSNGGGASVTVTGVGGPVVGPNLTVTPSILDFGFVRVGKSKDLSFTVQNTGEGTLAGTATATDPFSVVTNSSFTLDAGDLLLVTARFSPPTTGPFTGTVEFTSNGGDFTATVTGRGRGKLLPREGVVSVAIDIEPEREANSLDCQSRGEMAVGILDVLALPSPIEVSTLELEGAVAQSWVAEDVDGDGEKDDWVVYFEIQGVNDEACQESVISFFLTGELADGTPIEGWDEVRL